MAKANVTIAISGSYNGKALEKARNDLEKLNTRTAAEMGGFIGSVTKAGGKVAELGGTIHNMGYKAESIGSSLTKGVTLPIAGAAAACGAAAIDIDTALTGVKKTVDGTAEQYGQLKQSAIEFSKTNAVSASQILDIQALGAQLGFAIDELDEFGKVVSGLDIATDMDADTAATELAQFANITKMAHSDVEKYASAIVGLGNTSATTESAISSMAMRIAASGTQVGMSQADILGLAAALSSMGIEAEAGGTAISTVMANIDKAVALNSDSLQTWAETAGMSTEDFARAWKEKPVEALSAVLSNMEKATSEGGNMSLMLDELGISSLRQTDVMKRLAGNSDLVAKSVATANQEWDANTALQKEVDNRNESMAARFEILKNRVTAVAEEVGTPLVNAALEFVDAAGPVFQIVENVANAFSDMDEGSQKLVVGLAAAAAAAGPVLSIGGKVAKGVGNVTVGLGKLMQGIGKTTANIKVGKDEFGRLNTSMGKTVTASTKAAKATDSVGKSAKVATASTNQLGVASGKAGVQLKAEAKSAETASASMGKAGKNASVLSGALGGFIGTAGVALVGAAVGIVSSKMEEAREKAEKLDKATTGLKESTNAYYSSLGSAGEASEGYVQSLGSIKARTDEMIERNAELAESISGIMSDAGARVGELEYYRDAIDTLGGRCLTSSSDVSELQAAVKNVNEALGTSYQVVREADGSYQIYADGVRVAKDEVLNLIDAEQRQIQLEANHEAWVEAYKGLSEDAATAAEATKKYNETVKKKNELTERMVQGDLGARLELYKVDLELADLKKTMDDANATTDARKKKVESLKDAENLLTAAQQKGAESIEALISSSDMFMATMSANGQSTMGFVEDLNALGVSQQQLCDIGEENLPALAEAYDGSVTSIAAKLSEFGLGIDGTKLASAEMVEAMTAHLATLDEGMQLKLSECGVSLNDFCLALSGAGLSVSDFETLSNEQLLELAQDYANGNTDIKSKLDQFVANNRQAGRDGGNDLKDKFENALDSMKESTARKSKQISRSAKMELGSADTKSAGTSFVQGFVNGMLGVNVWRTAWNIGKSALGAIKSSLGIHSPSREAMKVGEYFGLGAVVGMRNTEKDIAAEADRMSESMNLSPRAYDRDLEVRAGGGAMEARAAGRAIVVNLTVNVTAGSRQEAAELGKTLGEQLYTEFARKERAAA